LSTAAIPVRALRIVPPSTRAASSWPPIGDAWGRARHAIDLLEDRWMSTTGTSRRRYATRMMARRAVHELMDLVALVGLHLPLRTKRDRQAEAVIVGQVLDAMVKACGCTACKRSAAGGAP
jgi:hypothetical protein